jgi:hypothetical protein
MQDDVAAVQAIYAADGHQSTSQPASEMDEATQIESWLTDEFGQVIRTPRIKPLPALALGRRGEEAQQDAGSADNTKRLDLPAVATGGGSSALSRDRMAAGPLSRDDLMLPVFLPLACIALLFVVGVAASAWNDRRSAVR